MDGQVLLSRFVATELFCRFRRFRSQLPLPVPPLCSENRRKLGKECCESGGEKVVETHLKELGKEGCESGGEKVVERGSEDDEDEDGIPQDQGDGHGKILQGMPEVRRLCDLLRPVSMSEIQAFLEEAEREEEKEEEKEGE